MQCSFRSVLSQTSAMALMSTRKGLAKTRPTKRKQDLTKTKQSVISSYHNKVEQEAIWWGSDHAHMTKCQSMEGLCSKSAQYVQTPLF